MVRDKFNMIERKFKTQKPNLSPPMPVDQHILTEKSKNKTTSTEQSTASASELAKLNSKMDMIMKTLVLMDKRLTLVEDQLRKQDESG